jgi:hypothetical protein
MDVFWPPDGPVRLSDGLTPKDVIDALHAPAALAVRNAIPEGAPTTLVLCVPTDDGRLITVVCTRHHVVDSWQIFAARDASVAERELWKRRTS